jgi:hypothetical protein
VSAHYTSFLTAGVQALLWFAGYGNNGKLRGAPISAAGFKSGVYSGWKGYPGRMIDKGLYVKNFLRQAVCDKWYLMHLMQRKVLIQSLYLRKQGSKKQQQA